VSSSQFLFVGGGLLLVIRCWLQKGQLPRYQDQYGWLESCKTARKGSGNVQWGRELRFPTFGGGGQANQKWGDNGFSSQGLRPVS